MKLAIEFMTAATQSGAHLYRELAVSAFQLIPALSSGARAKAQSRPLSRVGESLATTPTAVPLHSRSPQTL